MRILVRIISVLLLILIAVVLIQNVNYQSPFEFFDRHYPNVQIPLLLLISCGIGFLFGALILSLLALQYKADTLQVKKKLKGIQDELDSLRNLSIDDITLDEEPLLHNDVSIQVPLKDNFSLKEQEK